MLQPLAPVSPCVDTQLCLALSTRSEPQIGLALKGISLTTGTDYSPNKIKWIAVGLLWVKINRNEVVLQSSMGMEPRSKALISVLCMRKKGWKDYCALQKVSERESETWDLWTSTDMNSRTRVVFRSGKAVFSLLGAGEHGSYSKINTAHLSGAVWWQGVCANIGALQETLRSVCIFSQSDWSKTQPLMCHFKWTPCPNENTHTYKPHLIEGYRFSHSRQFFFSSFFFSNGRREHFLKSIFSTCFPAN